jgi:phosphoribosylglycinamide formyltransferase-1
MTGSPATGALPPLDLVVLVSGSGSNLQAILDAIAAGRLAARVRLVLSNVAGVRALERAAAAGVAHEVLSHKGFSDRAAYDRALAERVERAFDGAPDDRRWVVLAGFMRIVGPAFLDRFPGGVINVHPALLPAFPGMHAQAQAFAAGVAIAGCTVHLVDAGTDTGPIIAQAAVPVLPDDDADALAARILRREHELLPAVLEALAAGHYVRRDGRIVLDGASRALGVVAPTE